tara:strand:- start:3240 stop:3818 length:579 start_codon:yes stop_codon:yes gene_type:complete
MAYPLIKYTLTIHGRQPEWLCTDSGAFKGQHGVSANKAGKLPRFGSPQDTIYLGMGCGDVDSDGTPDGYVGSIASKADLQTYLTTVGAANSYRVLTDTVTGVQTSIITGTDDAWFTGVGLSTTTTDKVTFSGTGNVVEVKTATSTSRTIITTDGAESRTDTITTTDTTTFETAYDYAAEATRLWDIYEAVNS